MSVAERFRTWVLRGMVKAANLPVPFVPEWQRVQYMTPTFRALCIEGVRANGIVFNCISAHVFAYPEARLQVYKKGNSGLEPLPNHPLQLLLDNPNPQMGQAELLQHIALYKVIGGNTYLYKVRSNARKVVELLPLNDSQIVPVAGATLPISHYLWINETTGKEESIPADDIVHLKWMPDPLAPWRGLAPLVAVAREVDTDNAARKYLFTLLRNDAIPRLVVTMPPGSHPLDADSLRRLKVDWQEKYGGDNRGLPFIAGGGMDVKTLSLNLQELAFEALSKVPEARIAGSFRVPPVMAFLNVGLEQMTYNNMEGMDRFFTQRTMVPLWRMDADEIGSDLLKEFGGSSDLIVKFDTSEVASLQENVKELRTWANDALRSGGITRAQYQAYLGLPPDPNGNVYLMPMTTIETPAGIVSPSGKMLLPPRDETKAKTDRRSAMIALIETQRQNRANVAGRMEPALDNYFGGLADRIIHRALTAGQPKNMKTVDDTDWVSEYEGGVPHWAEDLTPSLFAQQFVEELRETGGKTVLEIGCGNGRDSIFFARAGLQATAIDMAPGAVELARQNVANAGVAADIQVGNANTLTFSNGAFDGVFSLSVLHASDLTKSTQEIARVLKTGGLFLVHLYADVTLPSGEITEYISVDAFLGLLKISFEVLDFYSEQEDEVDEYGEKHRIMVAHARRL